MTPELAALGLVAVVLIASLIYDNRDHLHRWEEDE